MSDKTEVEIAWEKFDEQKSGKFHSCYGHAKNAFEYSWNACAEKAIEERDKLRKVITESLLLLEYPDEQKTYDKLFEAYEEFKNDHRK